VGAGQPRKKPAFCFMKKIDEIEFNKKLLATACRTVRLEHGMSVDDFAEFSGFTRQTINNFESGRHVTLDVFLKYYALDTELVVVNGEVY
jgi:predicted transcriptional regulator